MVELVYFKTTRGTAIAQVWHDRVGSGDLIRTNQMGNLMTPSAGGGKILQRIDIKPEDAHLLIDELVKLYPLGVSC
jgi:hypothetical protein